jgi:serine/threonine protein kinase
MLCLFTYTILNTCVLLCNCSILSSPCSTTEIIHHFLTVDINPMLTMSITPFLLRNPHSAKTDPNMSSPPEFKINLYRDYKAERTLGKGGEGEAILWTRQDSVPSTGVPSTEQECVPLIVVKTVRKPKDSRVSPREVRFLHITRQHNHPNVIHMFGWCDTRLPSEKAQVLLEYCDQGDLVKITWDHDRQGQTVKEMMIWEVIISLLSALAFLHEGTINGESQHPWKPIIHRDIKPENILCCSQPDGSRRYKLADFGLCAFWRPDHVDVDTVGTVEWQRPELPHVTTTAADVWSVGAVLHWLAHREAPVDPYGLKSWQRIDMNSQELLKRYPRRVIPINMKARHRWSNWVGTPWEGVGNKRNARPYSNTLNDYMMHMLAFDPRRRSSAVELEAQMRADYENGKEIALAETKGGHWDYFIDQRGEDANCLDVAFDYLMMKDNPALWYKMYPHISLVK